MKLFGRLSGVSCLILLGSLWSLPVRAGIIMAVKCQQNLSDGRILVSEGNLLPENARYKVLSYTPISNQGGWSYGECKLNMTKGVSG